jgi:outer membrane protein OmpA-like peptidoglycan-associated protein
MKKPFNIFLYRTFVVAIFAAFSCSITMAQYVADYKRNADKYYAKGDWYSAATYYEKYLEQQKKPSSSGYEPYTIQSNSTKKKNNKSTAGAANDNEVVYRIAESYRKLNDYSKAAPYYAKSLANTKTYPFASYYYAVCLRATNQYAEAEKQFDAFLKSPTNDADITEHAKLELANCKFIQLELAKKDAELYKVNKHATSTAVGANYAAVYNNNEIIFSSSRADSSVLTNKNKNPFVNNVYTTVGTSVQKLNLPFEVGTEQGAASITADGKRIYFTRWNKSNNQNISAIYLSENKNGSWAEPVKLGTNVNAEGANSKQPYVSTDGKFLLYASNRTGSVGKFDLWYAPLNSDGEPGSFINLGNNINTKDDDEAPYYNAASNSLVFASNGRVGMGGFDLYESKGTLPSSFGAVANLGYPVNSVKDDLYFTNKGSIKLLQDAIISTDRGSACCLELYTINKTYKKFVTGTINDCKTNLPIAGASINVVDKTTGKNVIAQNTDENGKYFFEVKAFEPSTLSATKTDYNNGSLEYSGSISVGQNNDTLINTLLCLVPIEKEEPKDTPVTTTDKEPESLDEQSVLFDFNKYSLRKETATTLDTLAAILIREKNLGLEILGYTDKLGNTEYNLKLSQERADACLNYLIKKGVDANKLKAIGKGECCPLEPETINGKDNPAGRQANRRVEFKIKLRM